MLHFTLGGRRESLVGTPGSSYQGNECSGNCSGTNFFSDQVNLCKNFQLRPGCKGKILGKDFWGWGWWSNSDSQKKSSETWCRKKFLAQSQVRKTITLHTSHSNTLLTPNRNQPFCKDYVFNPDPLEEPFFPEGWGRRVHPEQPAISRAISVVLMHQCQGKIVSECLRLSRLSQIFQTLYPR